MLTVEKMNECLSGMERRLIGVSPIDGRFYEGLRLTMHLDGSGTIDALARDHDPDDSGEKLLLRRVFAEYMPYRTFDSLAELEAILTLEDKA